MNVIPVDYGSIDCLTDALRQQQALISTLSGTALSSQLNLIHAAAAAGVRRFIPSEFGTNTHNSKVAALPIFRNKTKVQEALHEYGGLTSGGHEGDDNSDDDYNDGKGGTTDRRGGASTGSKMSYTIIYTGPFLDWGLQAPFILDIRNRFVELIDGGDREFSCTTLPAVGQAVVGVLKNPDQTRNQALYIQDCVTSINKLAEMVTQVMEDWFGYGYRYAFREAVVTTDEVVERAWDELRTENPDPEKFVLDFVKVAVWGEGFGGKFNQKRVREDCEKIGVRGMTEVEVRRVVEAAVAIIAAAEERRCSYEDDEYDGDNQ